MHVGPERVISRQDEALPASVLSDTTGKQPAVRRMPHLPLRDVHSMVLRFAAERDTLTADWHSPNGATAPRFGDRGALGPLPVGRTCQGAPAPSPETPGPPITAVQSQVSTQHQLPATLCTGVKICTRPSPGSLR